MSSRTLATMSDDMREVSFRRFAKEMFDKEMRKIMTEVRRCKRHHKMTADNTKTQLKKYRRADGKITKTRATVCRKCIKHRDARRAKGLPVRDLRKAGRRT